MLILTGCNGLIGSQIRYDLQDLNLPYLATSLNPSSYENEDILSLNLTDPDAFKDLIDVSPDCIVHCAALLPSDKISHDEAKKTNELIDSNIIKACTESNAHLIYMSGTTVYGLQLEHLVTEDCSYGSDLPPYILQKSESEILIQESLSSSLILRVSAPYGPNQRSKTVLQQFIKKAFRNEDLYYYGTGGRMQDFTHVKDISNVVLSSLAEKISGVFNISYGCPISMKSLGELVISKVPGCKSQLIPANVSDPQENHKALFDISKAKSGLNWNPKIDISSGIAECLISYQL